MDTGIDASDTLLAEEAAWIADVADRACPGHDFDLRCTEDGIAWAVLAPREPGHLRFTICRIEPCLIVLIEDAFERRQVRALGTIEDAMDFVRGMIETAPERADERVLH